MAPLAQAGAAATPGGPTWLRSMRPRMLPPHLEDLGWAPVWSLLYLGFLFMNWGEPNAEWLRLTFVSIAIFLPLYFRCYWLTGWKQLAHLAAIAGLAGQLDIGAAGIGRQNGIIGAMDHDDPGSGGQQRDAPAVVGLRRGRRIVRV